MAVALAGLKNVVRMIEKTIFGDQLIICIIRIILSILICIIRIIHVINIIIRYHPIIYINIIFTDFRQIGVVVALWQGSNVVGMRRQYLVFS